MKKLLQRGWGMGLVCAAAALSSACSSSGDDHGATTPTTASESLTAMDSLLAKYPSAIGFHDPMKHWGFKFASGDKIEWTADTSANVADFAFVLAAQPLVDAGVDVAKLKAAGWLYNDADPAMGTPAVLVKPVDLDATAAGPTGTDSASSAFARLVNRFPTSIGFHMELQHYGFKMPTGDKFEWTKDLAANDADMAFVLVAQPLVDAGIDLAKIQAAGWLYQAATDTTPALLIKPFRLN